MLVTVPGMCPLTPHLMKNPIFAYCLGTATVSRSFSPSLLVDITSVLDKKIAMACCHESQFLEWVPYNQGQLDQVPAGAAERRRWLEAAMAERCRALADNWRGELVAQYGEARGRAITAAEGVQACPFGTPLDEAAIRRLFPFVRS